MQVYLARQPIFDRNLNVYGYELLYRKSMNNFYEGIDDNKATAELINNAFLTMHFDKLTHGTRAFINFSEKMLVEEIPLLLPREAIVVEILERVEVSEDIINLCNTLKKEGYLLALDDFIYDELHLPLIEIVDIIKLEFSIKEFEKHRKLIREHRNRVKFLAEKIETREEFHLAMQMGYDYFQGYFFSKPVIMADNEINSLNVNLIRIMNELNEIAPDYQRISEIIEKDIGLTYKLLKAANSIYYGSINKMYSVKQALIRIGIKEIKKWIYLMMLKEIQSVENKELIRVSLTRAKLMELLGIEAGMKDKHLELFLTGMFSSIDILLNKEMGEVVKEVPLTEEVQEALLENDNSFRRMLNNIIALEEEGINEPRILDCFNINYNKFIKMYIEALEWVNELDY